MSREVVLYLRPLREGHGSAPAFPWQESTHACERDAMAELESPTVPMHGAWLVRVERTGARTRDGRGYTVREGVRAYVVRGGDAVPLPALHRRKGMASWLRTYGPDIVRAWETADNPSVMTGWLWEDVSVELQRRALDADTLADPAAPCCAIREAVTVDRVALALEMQALERLEVEERRAKLHRAAALATWESPPARHYSAARGYNQTAPDMERVFAEVESILRRRPTGVGVAEMLSGEVSRARTSEALRTLLRGVTADVTMGGTNFTFAFDNGAELTLTSDGRRVRSSYGMRTTERDEFLAMRDGSLRGRW